MKRLIFLFLSVLVSISGFAEEASVASVTDVSCRQMWPWSGDVEITFTVSGKATPVSFVAQYDGVEPFTLSEYALSGDFFNAAPGRRRVRWSPARAGLDAKALNNFRIVSATPKTEDGDRTYLILNLEDGTYKYCDTVPEGGWHDYYIGSNGNTFLRDTTNMVFRRIPAGVAKLGLNDDLRDLVGLTSKYNKSHTATISSDFYIGVFPVTQAQYRFATNYYVNGTKPAVYHVNPGQRHRNTYVTIRGSTADGIDWPNTKFKVAPGSIVNAFRNIVKDSFPKDWIIDLPTAAQWEYACRATTPDDQLWSVGGKKGDSDTTLTNLLSEIAAWTGHTSTSQYRQVGKNSPNGWGLYDMIGLAREWNLDWYSNSYNEDLGVDPVGPVSGTGRVCRTQEGSSTPKGWYVFTSAYKADLSDASEGAFRLCIHLTSPFAK